MSSTLLLRSLALSSGQSVQLFHPRGYHLTAGLADKYWRQQKGLPVNQNAYGPLIDGPDYSFVDGRPTPLGSGKLRRMEKQLKLSKKIIALSKEVEFAVQYREQRDQEEKARKEGILSRKLKPKGQVGH